MYIFRKKNTSYRNIGNTEDNFLIMCTGSPTMSYFFTEMIPKLKVNVETVVNINFSLIYLIILIPHQNLNPASLSD